MPDTGSVGFSRINETDPDDASYIKANNAPDTAGSDLSEFELASISPYGNIGRIVAVQAYTRMFKDEAGDASVQVSMLSGAAAADGEDRPITTEPTYWMDVFEQDPNTSAPWTEATLNDALIRFNRTA